MNHSRHHAREVALQILYCFDVDQQKQASVAPAGADLARELVRHFDHFQVAPGVREFAAELVAGTLSSVPSLDTEIEKYAANWKVNRMAVIDRNLLRMALYEMQRFHGDIPATVTIDEAVELAKQFGSADTSSFVNAILDSARKAKSA